MVMKVAFNPTESPQVIDDDGRTLPGMDRAEVDTTSDHVKAAIESGRLIWAQDPPEPKSEKSTTKGAS